MSALHSLNTLTVSPSRPDDDMALSPTESVRVLYAESVLDRPSTDSRYRHKDMREMMGMVAAEKEFDALPPAVRRKYLSTLERLWVLQTPPRSAARNRRLDLTHRRGLSVPCLEQYARVSPRSRQQSRRQLSVPHGDASWYLALPDTIRRKQFSREERELLESQVGEKAALDPTGDTVIPSASQRSMDAMDLSNDSDVVKAMIETFRWMDEEEDLDLRLYLDDYHANLDGAVLPTAASTCRPSFRRHLSMGKMPFGRSSTIVLNTEPTVQARRRSQSLFKPISKPLSAATHSRQASRTTSFTLPRHTVQSSISSIEPVSHYQNPEARLKLRAYLSPQKFDEAVEFGFSSIDRVTDDANKENMPDPREGNSIDQCPTFLHDESSLYEDDLSMPDPESPLTPHDEGIARFQPRTSTSTTKGSKTSSDYSHLGLAKPTVHKPGDFYSQIMSGQREMTLRMTLTRPDLRSDEATVYGWQTKKQFHATIREDEPSQSADSLELPDVKLRGPLGGPDGWGPEKESGRVKRLWNRVRRN